MAGRRPNTALKNKLWGTKNPVNDNQPSAPEGAPEKPEGLSATASREWDLLVCELTELGIISECDRATIEMAARYAGHYHDADATVQAEGLTVATKQGMKANPSIRARDDAARIRKTYLEALGLTPASRSKVSRTTDAGGGDELDAILNGGDDDE
jgi:P27 family predicted phage terminase small subunit